MTILDQIIDDTREVIRQRKRDAPPSRLEDEPLFTRPTRSLQDALQRAPLSVIAECKKASPSAGVIREAFDPADLAQQYETHGAAAISVLTEPLHFQGSLGDLAQARAAVHLPLLRKDFIIDSYQLLEARAYGADAVLLIAAVLDRSHLYDLHQAADELELACLVEVYDLNELDRIDFDQVSILGVNNRDLRTFEVDIDHSVRVFEAAPETVVQVSESGLRTASDLAYLHRHGVDAVLIGETFMRANKPGQALADLLEAVHSLTSS